MGHSSARALDKDVETDLGDDSFIRGSQLVTGVYRLHAVFPSVRHDDRGRDRVGVGERHVPGPDTERFGAAGRKSGDLESWRARAATKDVPIDEPHAAEAGAERLHRGS